MDIQHLYKLGDRSHASANLKELFQKIRRLNLWEKNVESTCKIKHEKNNQKTRLSINHDFD